MEKGYARCMMARHLAVFLAVRSASLLAQLLEAFPIKRNEFSNPSNPSPPFHSLPACLGSFRSALPFTVCALLSLTPRLSPSLGRFVTLLPPSIVGLLGVCTSCASGYPGLQPVRWRSRCPLFTRRCWGSNGNSRLLHHHPQPRPSGIAGSALRLCLGLPASNPDAEAEVSATTLCPRKVGRGNTPYNRMSFVSYLWFRSPMAFGVLIRFL